MAPKKGAREATPSKAPKPKVSTSTLNTPEPTPATSSPAVSTKAAPPAASAPKSRPSLEVPLDQVPKRTLDYYLNHTPKQTFLIDAFLVFLLVTGAIQFLYCALFGTFPFNAFLSGFCQTVGQFVLTVALRIQTTAENKAEFGSMSPERAFTDYVIGSLLLHFFIVTFVN